MSTAMTVNARPGELVLLGVGPVASVYSCVDVRTGAAFAMKVYPGPIDRRVRAELDAELGRLAQLRTRAGLLVADRVQELPDGRAALRMELCAPSRLHLVRAADALSVPEGLALGHSVAAALAAAHSAGLVHGGVTPGNVLFRPSGEPVLADFGRTLRRVFPSDTRYGAEYYLAPETVRAGVRDQHSDLYGLGMVLRLALSRIPIERPDLRAGLAELISTLLAPAPAARTISAATAADRLGALLGEATGRPSFDDFAGVIATRAWGQRPAPPRPVAQPPAQRGRPPAELPTPPHPSRTWPYAGVVLAVVGTLSVLAVALVVLLLS